MQTNPVWLLVVWLLFTYPIVWLYSVLLHYYFGQTLGKWVLGLRVVDNQTERQITLRQALLRDSVIIVINLSLMFLIMFSVIGGQSVDSATFQSAQIAVGYVAIGWALLEIITCIFNRKRRALHDFIAGTVVVRTKTAGQSFASNSANY